MMRFLFLFVVLVLHFLGCSKASVTSNETVVADVHSKLNTASVREIIYPKTEEDVRRAVLRAKKLRLPISIAGSRHAMGGQQFVSNGILLDMRRMNKGIKLDRINGILTVQAGAEWPEILNFLQSQQKDSDIFWTFRQKQTGADRLSIGGALSANVHGRGLIFQPFVGDVESFRLVLPDGQIVNSSRSENYDLFKLAIGGYGLFGVITEVNLKLGHRKRLVRRVWLKQVDEVMPQFEELIKQGFLYGDWQFDINHQHADFLLRGVLSAYQPIEKALTFREQKKLTPGDWENLTFFAHFDKQKAWDMYTRFYLSTDGQEYWSDESQLSYYAEGYHEEIDKVIGQIGSEMISEFYVPRNKLAVFMKKASNFLREKKANVIYGTVRLIEKDRETFLAWAREPWACIVINLHVDHSDEGIARAQKQFQGLIDIALDLEGSFFLTYHHWARKDQIIRAYPQFVDFLRKKLEHDPQELFQSNWYRYYKELFKEELKA